MSKFVSRLLLSSAIGFAIAPAAQAQTAPPEAEGTSTDESGEGIVVIGSRRKDRSITDSSVAIDVISPEEITTTGYTDMNDALRTLVPAFNVQRLQGNDGSSFVRPVTLRGSPADHVLLLMNGKRRHRASIVQIGTGHASTSGSQGQDFNVIPPIAFSNVEVLRDGASAQYGSDAIAGVVNLELKKQKSGGSIMAQAGEYYSTGGRTYDIQGHLAVPVGENAYFNIAAQYTDQAKAFAKKARHAGAEALKAAGVRGVPAHPEGNLDPRYMAFKSVWNAGVELSEEIELYTFGNYMMGESSVTFGLRQPFAAGGLNGHSTYANSAYDLSPAHPQAFNLASIYPGGFTPEFAGDLEDFSSVVGVRDQVGRLSWDLSARYGNNTVDYLITGTINASMGVNSPTAFKPGSLTQRELQFDGEMSYELTDEVLVFAGVSHRKETYVIGQGDQASYTTGPLRDLPAGSNGFQGFSPEFAGSFDSSSYAVFAEVDADITPWWNLSVAGRYEDYDQFGTNFSYKAATRFELSDAFALRGSVSTGFRAPAAGQVFGTSLTSQLDGRGGFILDAVLVPGSPAAQVFGSQPLTPETSFNMSAGVVFTGIDRFLTTLDFYQIDVDDRLLLTPSRNTTAAERAALAAIGFPNGADIEQVRYFQNEMNTRVRGFDLVSTYRQPWSDNASTDFSLAVNYNEQHLRGAPPVGFSPAIVTEFERGTPRWRGNFSTTTKVGDFALMGRATHYGAWRRLDGATFLPRKAVTLFDAEVTYSGIENVDLSIGARNLFNIFPPDRGAARARAGLIYDNHSVFGVAGGFYYVNAKMTF
ncbi:TonB-dependent receptor [Sphingosinicella sp. LY1275]|uniref:TonB-dependent receptor plug domain-containing protein n=1 Tax=Sphingosinicella sp. LY1275 TaxID=3095379 RepID=UPI002ADEF70A|nr:TonB-dependent receptor [Sphingosinicella sp. LY1275]MEA1015552.1 TonB-dependent receptor [Sphingosinicella sp. LY1275]